MGIPNRTVATRQCKMRTPANNSLGVRAGKESRTMNNSPPLAYSIAGACTALTCGRTWLYARLKSGEIEAIRRHGRTMIPAASLHRFIAGGA